MKVLLDQFTIIETQPFSELKKMYVICLYYCKYGGVDQLKEKSSQLKSCSNSIHYNFLFIYNLF